MNRADWIWMPHPGHFICARDCQFHLNTYVNGHIVSTVGEYWPPRPVREIHAEVHDPKWLTKNKPLRGDDFDQAYQARFGFVDIGFERKYETMIFPARAASPKEIAPPHDCCPWRMASATEIEFRGYATAGEAYRGHLELCAMMSTMKHEAESPRP